MSDSFTNKARHLPRLIYLSVLLCASSCENSEPGFYPLDAGLVWQYDIQKQTVNGISRQKDIIQNMGVSNRDGETTFIQNSISGSESHYQLSTTAIRLKYTNLPGGTRINPGDTTAIVFYYPLSVGTQWQDFITTSTLKSHDRNANDVIEAIPVTVTIESINDTVVVAAGKFRNCIRVVSVGEKLVQKGKYAYQGTMTIRIENTRWYASGVGLVKEEHVEDTDILQYPKGWYIKTLDRVESS